MGSFSLRLSARGRKTKLNNMSGSLVTVADPFSAASEAYRTLRTSLLYAHADAKTKVIVITSPGRREGKSTTCANLGVVLAQADKSTLLLDCDFRKPALHKIFAVSNRAGITDMLADMYDFEEVLQEPQPGLKIVTAGPTPLNPAELVSSVSFSMFLDKARHSFDYVIVDSPPVGLVSDPLVLAAQGDGVLLVFDANSTRKWTVRRCVRSLKGVGAEILGTVVNNGDVGENHNAYGYTYGR